MRHEFIYLIHGGGMFADLTPRAETFEEFNQQIDALLTSGRLVLARLPSKYIVGHFPESETLPDHLVIRADSPSGDKTVVIEIPTPLILILADLIRAEDRDSPETPDME